MLLHRFAFAVSVLAAAPLAAQAAPEPPRAGERVRARIAGPEAAPVGVRCGGRVAAVAGDTLVLAAGGSCPAGALVSGVRVARGDRGSRWAHAGLGLLGGAVVGGVAARLSAGDGCRVSGCDDGGYAVGVLTVVGTVAGAAAGAVLGAALPAGPRWVAAGGAARPVRVAGLALRPGVRVAAGRGRR